MQPGLSIVTPSQQPPSLTPYPPEPLFTMVLASIFLDSEVATFRVVLGLLPVVLGASLSAAGRCARGQHHPSGGTAHPLP